MLFGIPIPTILVSMASFVALLTVVAIALPFISGMEQANRFKLVTRTRANLSRQQLDGLAPKGSAIRQRKSQGRVELMKKILAALKLDEALSSKNLKASLAQAGYRSQNALVVYIFTRVVLALGLPSLAAFVLFVMWKDFPHPPTTKALIVAVSFAIGYYLPSIIIKNSAQKRQKDLNSGFADALDLMVICVEGGLSVEGAFDRVTDEIADKSPTLAQEFGITSAELAYLGDRHKAYINFSDRTGLPAVKSLTTTLIQSEKYGTPVGQALKVLSKERREERMAVAEKKGASLPAQLTVPMILFFLPPLFLVVIGPAAIKISGAN